MARKKFTEEEMNVLRGSAYIIEVTPSIVHFSAEFKEKFWLLLVSGRAPREAIIELGIDSDLLGESRINGLKTMLRNELRAGNGFRDKKTYTAYLSDYANPAVKIKYLEQQLAYKNQEIEFLKKIASLGKGAAE